jgi:hypothetical protein
MGEAKRRAAREYALAQETFPPDSAAALTASVLQNIADKLECAIFIKEPDDQLLDSWPLGAIIGQTTSISRLRECPFVKDIREKLLPQRHWEFLITEKFLHGAYAVDAMKRGLDFPGPIDPPEDIADHVRRWFTTNPPFEGGWKAVVPHALQRSGTEAPRAGCDELDEKSAEASSSPPGAND